MDNELSRRVALELIGARLAEDVQKIIEHGAAREWFDDPQHWTPYGNRDKNWDTVGNQQTNPVGALVEIITNGIDAILLRKARENGIADPRAADAPQSMFDAVHRFFPSIVEGKIARLAPSERGNLARQCIRVAIARGHHKKHIYPTYTIIDSGDGQRPADFPKTFLSLSERNKEGVPFVQGKFNMGSTGTLRFCTRSDIRLGHYKLIVSRHPGEQYWGWTLVRVREPRQGEALPVAEFFHPYGRVIPKFSSETIRAFSHETLGLVSDGSIIKLFEYDIGPGARAVDFGLYNALTVNLIDCALPVQLYDFDAKRVEGKGALRREGIAERTFGGLNTVLRADMAEPTTEEEDAAPPQASNTEWVYLVEDIKDADLGHIQIIATGVSKLKDFLSDQPARIFYTINGQTHAFERASFLNTRVGLPDLRNHLLINVVCDEMNKTALATIFMPDRERKAHNDLARKLEQRVVDALKGDDKLRGYAAEVRRRRASEYIEDEGETTTLLQELIKADPAIRDLFGLGTFLPDLGKTPGGQEPFKGKKFPTFLRPLNLRMENGVSIKEVPVNGSRRIECGTDAADDYLTRLDSPGEVWSSLDERSMPHSVKLRNGIARFTIQVPKAAHVGQEVTVEFGFKDYAVNLEPLRFTVLIRYTDAEESQNNPTGRNTQTQPNQQNIVGEPKFEWVREDQWKEHSFTEDDGAYVATSESTIVYVNHGNRYLKAMRVKERDDAARMMNENMFRLGLGLLALSVHKKASAGTKTDDATRTPMEPEEITRLATSGMAPYVVTIIRRLGGAESTA